MAELTPYKPGRSQMGIDLLKAINEPSFTAQDLARQEEQERVEKFGGIRVPTQMENVWKGIEKTTGIQPYGDQPKLDRAMMAADILAPGIKGKAAMPAFKEGMAGAIPLITRFREMLNKKTGKVEKTPLYYQGVRRPSDFSLTENTPRTTRGTTHEQGGHFSRDTGTSGKFSMTPEFVDPLNVGMNIPNPFTKQKGLMTQVEIKGKGKRLFQHDPDAPNSTMDDFEAVGHDMANSLFGDKNGKELFKGFIAEHGKIGTREAGSVWERLRAFKGGFVDREGKLYSKSHLKTELKDIDDRIASVKKESGKYKAYKADLRKNVTMTPDEERAFKAATLKRLKDERKRVKEFWSKRYVKDFGSYLRKSKQTDDAFDSMAKQHYFNLYQSKLEKEGYSHVIYKNTNPWETMEETIAGQHFPAPTGRGGKDTAMVWNMDNVDAYWGK